MDTITVIVTGKIGFLTWFLDLYAKPHREHCECLNAVDDSDMYTNKLWILEVLLCIALNETHNTDRCDIGE